MNWVCPKKFDLLFIAFVANRYHEQFAENGAAKLNCMIQERSGLSSAEAFALIADAIEEGLIFVQRSDQRRLVVNDRILNEWRDRYTDMIAPIQAALVGAKWPLKPYRRELAAHEIEVLNKNIRRGLLYEVVRRTVVDEGV